MKLVIAAVNLLIVFSLCFLFWKHDQSSIKKLLWPALLLKCIAGIVLGVIYTVYYSSGDTFQYYADGVRLADFARMDFQAYLSFIIAGDETHPMMTELILRQPRALFLSKVCSFFCLLTWDNYWVTSVYFSVTSFITAWILVRKISESFTQARIAAVIGILFFPSVVLWSSGVIKESLAMAGLYYLAYLAVRIWARERLALIHFLIGATSLWLLWNLKYYYLAVFLPVTVTTLLAQFFAKRMRLEQTAPKLALWLIIFMLPVFIISLLHPNFDLRQVMQVIVLNHNEYQAISDPEDVIHYHLLQPTFLSLVLNSPWALVSGLFRPFLWEADNIMQVMSAFENLLLIALTVGALRKMKNVYYSPYRLMAFQVVVYVGLLCVFLALSTPNFGTLSRYRVGFLPFLVTLLIAGNPMVSSLLHSKIFRRVVR